MTDIPENKIIYDKVEVALVNSIYQQAYIGFIASIICSGIVLAYLYFSDINHIALMSWYTFFITVILTRAFMVRQYLKDSSRTAHIKLWQRLFIIGTFLSGLSWGLTGTPLLFPANDPLVQALIFVILAAVSAGAVPLFSCIPLASLSFLIPAILPFIIYLLFMNNTAYILLDITIIVFLIYLIALTYKTYYIIHQSFTLQFENDGLLIELSKAKHELEAINKKLEIDATHDPLTQVANRSLFTTILQDAVERADHEKQKLALLYIDLDKFKEANDTYGHQTGDQLLMVIIARIKNILRESDTVARIGGDEFIVILESLVDTAMVSDIAKRICLSVEKPIKIDHTETQIYASIGISIYPSDASDIKTLIQVADTAMYSVKEKGGNGFSFSAKVH